MTQSASQAKEQPILEVVGVKKHFPVTKGLLLRKVVGWIRAVDGISFEIRKGETVSLVGESGCGKTTTGRVILRQEHPTDGSILFRGQSIHRMQGPELRRYRSSVQAVFQDPWSSLNPRMKVGSIIAEPLIINDTLPRRMVQERVAQVLEEVGLDRVHANLYPHEFSGGQRQRVAVGRALVLNPSLVVLDEPVSALDVSIRAQIMNLLRDLQQEHHLSYLLIAHHLPTVRYISHRVIVMYLGKLVERADTRSLFADSLHPYTQALISAALPSHPALRRREILLTGEVPSPLNPPPGCAFHPRCPRAMPVCSEVEPQWKEASPGHWVACHLY